ncbi:hypothetical protein IHB14_000197 [Salmonella enterica]|uniref:hypothetical protein n=1 Tax=Enterobacteriaceae TaxID=543 RepID=UPI0009AC6AC2|nr:hypothetical protein [Salmonella enterica]EAA4013797.1 hypothetical protein [Salmonella enterica subsp. enterica serovar Montevideo]EAA7612899.1 hypothetical protein [Salmonella enterica subsp. enterica serovar Newport]EBB4009027.1 hypothetical protein [Salmonella enterica subsp. enterica serovar Ohio]EBN0036323.1 hypothetical protein [Salmonella enterica subsp. enterica serovar Virchow]EBX3071537.1 hypothetical protein [Salmonella enterica subsp. enterica serovar Livingstone]EBZ0942465.1 
MGKVDQNYQIVYRGEELKVYIPGGLVFFQRPKECGGGYWLGRTYDGLFWLELELPTSLHDGLIYLLQLKKVEALSNEFDDNFTLF